MINEQVLPVLLREYANQFVNGRFQRIWWAQDGAPAHRSNEISAWLHEFFGEHIVALNHNVEWPPRSPDLTPCDFFLWGYTKSKVFTSPPASIDELKDRITTAFDELRLNQVFLRRAARDMIRRVNLCTERDGGHVEGKFR